MTVTTRTVRILDVPLGPGRQTLRLALVGAGSDEPPALILSIGFGGSDGTEFLRPPWADLPLRIPADRIPAIRQALAEIEAGDTEGES